MWFAPRTEPRVRQPGQTGGAAPAGARSAPPANARPAPHAVPLGRRKRCPWCERLRQSGGALLFAARAPAKPAGGASRGAARTAGKRAGWVRLLALGVLAAIGLQLYFLLRVGMAAFIAPESTAFQRSELWRLMTCSPPRSAADAGRCPPRGRSPLGSGPAPASADKPLNWRQQWVPYERISDHLKRAVMASEDSRFTEHSGVEWEAIEKAWQRNAKAMEAAEKRAESELPVGNVRIRGGSTITQQLAKNLWLSSERSYPRKGQELLLAKELETLLPKRRILEIYLNNVEWGEGVFGAEAAARHYFKKPASALTPMEAARLAVMLPRPKFFERRPGSAYMQRQSGRIAARMRLVSPP